MMLLFLCILSAGNVEGCHSDVTRNNLAWRMRPHRVETIQIHVAVVYERRKKKKEKKTRKG